MQGGALHSDELGRARDIAAEALEVRDPVCGMTVEIASARYTSEHDGRHYYFCNVRCQESFQLEPARYLAAPPKPV